LPKREFARNRPLTTATCLEERNKLLSLSFKLSNRHAFQKKVPKQVSNFTNTLFRYTAPCHHGMGNPGVADAGDGLQIRQVPSNIWLT